MKLAPKLTILFLLLSIIPAAIVGYLAYGNGRRTIMQKTIDHLVSINIFKINELKRWIEDNKISLEQTAQRPLVQQFSAVLAKHDTPDPAYHKAKENIVEDHLKPGLKYGEFFELFVMRPRDGLISVSTDEKQEGRYRDTFPYFIEGKSRTHVQGVYYAPEREQPAMTISTPIKDKQGNLLGVLAGRLNLGELSKIIALQSGNSPTEDTYLVNTFNFFVTEPRFGQGYALKKAVRTEGVEAGLSGRNGVDFYKDYRGVPVIGAYKWLPESNMCILTEIDQAEAFAPIVHLAWVITGIVSAISIAAGLLGLFFARTITRPILTLQEGVVRFGQGQRDVLLSETRSDEIGVVAREFNQMASAISDQEVQLRNYSENLENIVKERTSALRESEERFRLAAESTTDLIYEWDIKERVDWFGKIDELLGYAQDEFPRTLGAWANSVHPDDLDRVMTAVKNHLDKNKPYDIEYRIRRKDGTYNYWWARGMAVRDEKGNPLRWVGAVTDITERKRSEEALRQSEERYRTTMMSVGDGVIATDTEGRVELLNSVAEALTGWHQEEARGNLLEDVFRIINEETRRTVENPVRRVMREGVVVGLANHTVLIAKNGTEYPIADSGAPIRHEKGEITGVVLVFRDRTQERTAEKALRESEGRFRATFEQAAVGIAQVGLEGRWLRVNQRLCDIVGYSHEELLQRTFQDITHRDDLNSDLAYVQQVLAGEIQTYSMEKRYIRKDRSLVWINLTVGLVNDEFGAPEYFVSVVEDITDRKCAEEEVRRLNESLEQRVQERTSQLEAANKEMEAFSYSVSHDLRAPLRAVDGYTRILLEDYAAHLNKDAQKICGNICDGAQRMGKLIDDLLAFSRLSRAEMQTSSIDMHRLANSVFFELTTPEGRESIDFRLQALPRAEGDPTMVRQIWMNLISNALKFSSKRERPVIEVGCRDGGKETIYYIRDNGAGFDKQYVHKLFGVFQRLHSTREFEGTGVGLAIVRRIVHRHGGRTWAEGETDKGATIYFTMPKKGERDE